MIKQITFAVFVTLAASTASAQTVLPDGPGKAEMQKVCGICHQAERAAAVRLTDAELAALGENIERMKATYDDYERFRALDNAFHAIVMKASGNEVGLTIVRTIHTHGGVMPPLASAASRAALKRTVDAHRAIYAALAARDGEAAGELISSHIHSAWAERKRFKRSA